MDSITYRLQLTQKELTTDPYFSSISECVDCYKRLNIRFCCLIWAYEVIDELEFLPYPSYLIMGSELYKLKKEHIV